MRAQEKAAEMQLYGNAEAKVSALAAVQVVSMLGRRGVTERQDRGKTERKGGVAMRERQKRFWSRLSIRTKLLLTFELMAALMFVINILIYSEISTAMRELDAVYATNVSLNDLSRCVEQVQTGVYEYLNTKSTDSLERYYGNVQTLRDLLEQLGNENVENERRLLEKNIRNMTETYLLQTEETVQAKRGRNVEKYNAAYNGALQNYRYIQAAVYRLNAMQFRSNSDSYQLMQQSLNYMEIVSSAIVIAVAVMNLLILVLVIRTMTEPLRQLALAANEVAAGNFEIALTDTPKRDEIGVVQHAFVKMVNSIRDYIETTKKSMETERKMKERELRMEAHLKDAQLKYLQAQINPHFLFNSLNAGAQLAMMEDAEQTSIFIEKMADFFRYNVRKSEEAATLGEELEAVDNYVYILNVRFAGEIHFERQMEPGMEEIRLPSMTLQPLVENAVNHGIRGLEREGRIRLEVAQQADGIVIRICDNGHGMTQERIGEVLGRRARGSKERRESTGIGIDNVASRLELFFGEKDLLQMESAGVDQGTEVRIRLPFSGPGAEHKDRGSICTEF